MTTYTVLILEKNSVQIADLTPDTPYVVRVQVVGPEVNPGSHSVEHVFHTSPLGTDMKAMGFFFSLFKRTNVLPGHKYVLLSVFSSLFAQLSLRSRTNLRW